MRIRRTLLIVSCLTTGGCAGINFTGGGAGLEGAAAAPPVAASPAPDGKRLAELANAAFSTAKLTGPTEISDVHPTHDSQWGDWVFCIRSGGLDPSPKYAVLIGHDAVLEVRSSVLIDGCDRETYHPLAPAPKGKAPPHK